MSVFLLSIRLAALLAMTPVLNSASIPGPMRVLFVLSLTVLLVSGFRIPPVPMPEGLVQVFLAAVTEALVGAVLAFGVFTAFAAFSLAGKLVDIQVGFGIGSVFDPVTRRQTPVLATGFDMLAVTMFFAMDGHHALMRGIAYSLERVPLGTALASLSLAALAKQFGVMFLFGVALVAPVVFSLLLVEVGLAMVSRVMPQMHIFVLGIPIRIFLGLSMLVLSLGYAAPRMGKIFLSIFTYWEEVLG